MFIPAVPAVELLGHRVAASKLLGTSIRIQ